MKRPMQYLRMASKDLRNYFAKIITWRGFSVQEFASSQHAIFGLSKIYHDYCIFSVVL